MRDNPTREVAADRCSKRNGYGGAVVALIAIFSIAGSAQPTPVVQPIPAQASAIGVLRAFLAIASQGSHFQTGGRWAPI
jgi:hypothetical protein